MAVFIIQYIKIGCDERTVLHVRETIKNVYANRQILVKHSLF